MNTPSKLIRLPLLLLALAGLATSLRAELEPEQQAKVEAKVSLVKAWAAEPAIIEAVAAHNAQLPTGHADMTQEKWKSLSVLDPLVRSFSKNPAGDFLKTKKIEWLTEAFVSDAKGLKVAFLSKPSGWSHAGKPKHDVPMTGKTWQGAVETDESTGLPQLQIAVPVLKDGHPIGSLVVGLSLGKL
ncbi:MAG: hypothetical protein IPP19_12280 [Verrucomicrobia bacterium]|nr:hypothetical protein [Verrucomicrobiota bacterium]